MILWLLMALPSSLTVTLSSREAGSKDLRWLLSQGWCHGREWPESWIELGLLSMVPLHSLPSMARSGELDSSHGNCIPHSGRCKITNHMLMSFCDLPSELTQRYFCHILLVKADTSLPRSQVKIIDSTSWWRSDLVTLEKSVWEGRYFWKIKSGSGEYNLPQFISYIFLDFWGISWSNTPFQECFVPVCLRTVSHQGRMRGSKKLRKKCFLKTTIKVSSLTSFSCKINSCSIGSWGKSIKESYRYWLSFLAYLSHSLSLVAVSGYAGKEVWNRSWLFTASVEVKSTATGLHLPRLLFFGCSS